MQAHHRMAAAGDRTGRPAERGAVIVEFALILPLLFGILFGIVDFGFNFSQTLDIRHGSREGARLAAVNYTGGSPRDGAAQTSVIIGEICARMDGGTGSSVELTLGAPTDVVPAGTVGGTATVSVRRPAASLSGVYAPLFDGQTMSSTVSVRIEVPATWTTASGICS
jgi:Flp pilus assembly protein TadG